MATEEEKNKIIDGMVRGSQSDLDTLTNWHHMVGGSIGSSIEIKIHFLTDPSYALSQAAQDAVRAAYKLWENISGIKFTEVADGNDAHITFGFQDFAAADMDPTLYGAAMDLAPNAEQATDPYFQVPIWFNTQKGVSNFENALNDPRYFRVLIHEIGHALGLEHPFDSRDGDDIGDDSLYSIMAKSYPEGIPVGTGSTARLPNEPPMAWDILAIQKLYGTNASYNPTDNYSWSADQNHYLAIWDTDGIDTIDVSNQAGKAEINLSETENGGGEVKIKNDAGEVTLYGGIAFDTVIENATGTNQDDKITGV